ncbi:MAG: hypothetical protein KTV68_02100 [Acidimicrobiia bacterium]|nr:hypothetical protein [Acidimicrobiia bacterium]MCY4435294.1 hypothetical protein [bacterium]
MWQLVVGRWLRIVVVAGVLAAGLGFVGASGAAAQSVADVEVRDRLVADQEALLNVYRCMFDVDVGVVPGGCADGVPVLPAEGPAPFSGSPTAQDITVRDQLIANQEALLNVYRCQFNIDTELVPGGCQDNSVTPTEEYTTVIANTLEPLLPTTEFFREWIRLLDFQDACIDPEISTRECVNAEDTQAFLQGMAELLECEMINFKLSRCVGTSQISNRLFVSSRSCPEGWYLDFYKDSHMCWHPDHPDFRRYISSSMYS